MPDTNGQKRLNPDVISGTPVDEKLPETEMMARTSQHLADAASELERDRGISIWLYGIALILLLFVAALIFLAAVASSPTPR